MKEKVAIFVSVLLSLTLLFTCVSAVQATSLPDPTVTLLTGNAGFATSAIAIQDLPGITSLADGMLVPAGFDPGSKQFEGAGLKLSGLGLSSAKLCFATTGGSAGWGGKVGMWDGKKWQLFATTIASAGENPYSWACSTVYADGTYAFIKWVVDPSKITSKPNCGYPLEYAYISFREDSVEVPGISLTGPVERFYVDPPLLDKMVLMGKSVTITILTATPSPSDATFSAPLTGILQTDGGVWFYVIPTSPVIAYENFENTSITFRFDFGSCVQDVVTVSS